MNTLQEAKTAPEMSALRATTESKTTLTSETNNVMTDVVNGLGESCEDLRDSLPAKKSQGPKSLKPAEGLHVSLVSDDVPVSNHQDIMDSPVKLLPPSREGDMQRRSEGDLE